MKILQGTSIIEIVIATALISVAIISALSLANYSQKQNNYAKGLGEATKYASQGADWIRTQRDTLGWATLASKALADDVGGQAVYCLDLLTTTESATDFTDIVSGNCQPTDYIIGTTFQRKMTITAGGPGILKVTIMVTWMENIERQATIETELTQWR